MIKPIIKDVFFLGQKAEPATKQDLSVGQDLQDTLAANQDRCVGMAANMIGVRTRGNVANRLWRALNSRHPYRAFKDAINDTGMANKYYDFRSLTFRRMAEEWCRDHKVRYFMKE